MKKNNAISNRQLEKTFKEMPKESLSADFVKELMSEIEKESHRMKRRQNLLVILQIVVGIAGMLFLPVLTIRLCGVCIPGFSFSIDDVNINLNQNYIVIGLAVLLLLVIDSLFRKRNTMNDER
jgi:hypothetical protein